jgi:mannosyl-oligosaccharide alpha-1,2-mannosidase
MFATDFDIASHGLRSFTATGSPGSSCIAEAGTYQVELLTLAKLTGDERFVNAATLVYKKFWKEDPDQGLRGSHIGACEDSYYEYVIKCYLLTRGTSREILRRYTLIARDIKQRLLFKTIHRNLSGIGEGRGHRAPNPWMHHLATFAGGMFGVGSVINNPKALEDLQLGAELSKTYATVYNETLAGVMGEQVRYNTNQAENPVEWEHDDPRYLLRPESVESVHVLWKFTGLEKFRDYAWQMFKGINRSCRVQYGFASIRNVEVPNVVVEGPMESYFLAETLKYLYLTFDDSRIISPSEWVFNTEAHPFRIWDPATVNRFTSLLQFEDVPTA